MLQESIQDKKQEVLISRVLKHSRSRVWRAISRSEEIAQWFMRNDFTLQKDAQITFAEEPSQDDCGEGYDGFIHARLLEFKAEEFITYTFKTNLMDDDSLVTFSLADHADGTELTIYHRNLTEGVKQKDGTYGDINNGWTHFSQRLNEYLDASDGTGNSN